MQPSHPEPSPAARARFAAPHRLLIGDRWREGRGRVIHTENPARGTHLASLAGASEADLDEAVASARRGLETGWGVMKPRDRSRILLRFADLLDRDAEHLGEVMTFDNGLPLNISTALVRVLAAEIIRYYGGWATKIVGESFMPAVGGRGHLDFMVATLREPVGVVGAIVPWNAPAGMIAMKLGPALAAGCTVVLKTAELAPLAGEIMAELLLEAGAPPGTLNLLHGIGHETGAAMALHPGIDKIAFTGSTAVGREIVRASVGNLKRVTLELGGKSPVVVFPDADLDAVVPGAAHACLVSTGQACMAGTRLFLHTDIHDEMVARIAEYIAGLRSGDGMVPGTDLGPLISARQKARVLEYIRIGREEDGATLLQGGEDLGGEGYFIRPAIFTDVRMSMRIAQEEIFGPVLSVLRFSDEDAMIADVNSTRYGLSGSIWTSNLGRALRLARRIDSGQVAINAHAAMSPETPFGGNRESGWGRELGREGLDAYLKTKAVSIMTGTSP